jgi:hypothetical protein
VGPFTNLWFTSQNNLEGGIRDHHSSSGLVLLPASLASDPAKRGNPSCTLLLALIRKLNNGQTSKISNIEVWKG